MRVLNYIIFALSVIFFSSCGARQLRQPDLEQFATDPANGLVQTSRVQSLDFSVSYRPTGLFLAQELSSRSDTAGIAALKKKYNSAHYLILNISMDGKEALGNTGDFSQFSELLQTFSFRIGEQVTLATSSGDTLVLGDFAFQRTYGMSSGNAILFAFLKQERKPYDWLEFTVREFGLGSGIQRFRFREKDIDAIPELDLTAVQASSF